MRLDPEDVRLCIEDEVPAWGPSRPTSVPIVQTSLFAFPDFQSLVDAFQSEHGNRIYSRGQNPTVEEVERKLAALERAEAARAFGSGMAAIHAVLTGLLQQGDHVLFVNQVYGPTLQLARHLKRFGITHDVCLDTEVAAVEAALRPETRMLWVESPGTMLFKLLDLPALAELARARGILTAIDNTWATPLLQKPLELGFDLSVHTATKYLGGHSDVLAGIVAGSRAHIEEIFHRTYLLAGGVLAPFDAWLLLRGMRTLPARIAQHEADGLAVARWLAKHPAVTDVYHPALVEDEARTRAQLRGFTSTFSFALRDGSFEEVRRVIDALEVFRIGVSWGGVESLVISPRRPSNGERLRAKGLPEGLIRLSVGLEGAQVLIQDLERAMA